MLIVACDFAFYLIETFTSAPVILWASQFWFRLGITRTSISQIRIQPFWETGEYIAFVETLSVYLLLQAILGWFGYRLLVRKPKPVWHRFIRFWYRSQLYGIIAFPAMSLTADASPGAPSNTIVSCLALAAMCAYIAFVPGYLAKREALRLARRLPSGRCPSCGYALRGLISRVCPECGTPITPRARLTKDSDATELKTGNRYRFAIIGACLVLGAVAVTALLYLHDQSMRSNQASLQSVQSFVEHDDQEHEPLVVLNGATDVQRFRNKTQGSFHVSYVLSDDYPARETIQGISKRLQSLGWEPLKNDFLNPGIPSSHVRGWTQFLEGTAEPVKTVDQWLAQWQDKSGNTVSYCLRYSSPAKSPTKKSKMRVHGSWFPAKAVKEMQAEAIRASGTSATGPVSQAAPTTPPASAPNAER